MLDKKKTSMRATTSDIKYRLMMQNDCRSPLLKRSPTVERISIASISITMLAYHQPRHGEP